jgi:hypothetical protein
MQSLQMSNNGATAFFISEDTLFGPLFASIILIFSLDLAKSK